MAGFAAQLARMNRTIGRHYDTTATEGACVYTCRGYAAVAVPRSEFDEEHEDVAVVDGQQICVIGPSIWILREYLPADPAEADTCTVGSRAYRVAHARTDGSGGWRMALVV